ncbi:MAG: cysteine--tRNA ligase [Actinomycetota bacterium]|nr:cysteine--tRNA ligase [Actinomycetota bacterium]
MSIFVLNTLTGTKQELVPRVPGKIGMYYCGPTVYNHVHVGNARGITVFDVVRRYLTWSGFDVTFVYNYTDVDDRIIDIAVKQERSTDDVSAEYSEAFEAVMRRLSVSPPDILVRATEHISDMVAMIEKLIEKGFAYESESNVWFAVDKFKGYGKLSKRSLDDMRAGERVEPDPTKKQPLDFALWKRAKPGEPSWPSPWGDGRPGWHIECSAMSTRYLGMGFDIHCGGTDLVFPHHENEIAQAEAAFGEEPFVKYWLHNGMVNVENTKMSKSLGNFIFVKDFLDEVRPEVFRFMSIAAHYRSDCDFSESAVFQAQRAIERFEIFLRASGNVVGEIWGEALGFVERFREAMDDDFNTPQAISILHELVRHGNAEVELASRGDEEAGERLPAIVAAFHEISGVLGITPSLSPPKTAPVTDGLIQLALDLRESARKDGRFSDADEIRARLDAMGIIIEDSTSGPRWRQKV